MNPNIKSHMKLVTTLCMFLATGHLLVEPGLSCLSSPTNSCHPSLVARQVILGNVAFVHSLGYKLLPIHSPVQHLAKPLLCCFLFVAPLREAPNTAHMLLTSLLLVVQAFALATLFVVFPPILSGPSHYVVCKNSSCIGQAYYTNELILEKASTN